LTLPLPSERFRLVRTSRARRYPVPPGRASSTGRRLWRPRHLDAWFWPRRAPRAARSAEIVRQACGKATIPRPLDADASAASDPDTKAQIAMVSDIAQAQTPGGDGPTARAPRL